MLNEHAEMGPREFEAVMKRQFKLYVQRQMSNAIEIMATEDKGRTGTILFVLKQMVVDLESLCGTNVVENGDVPGATSPTPQVQTQRQDRLGLLEAKVDNMQCSLDLILRRLDSKPSAFNMPSMPQSLGVLDFGRAFGTGKGKEETQNGELVASASSTASWRPLSLAVLEEKLKGRNSQNDGTMSRNTLPHFDDWESGRTKGDRQYDVGREERGEEICISARPTTSNDGELCGK
jgi:hypothetical protein